MEEEKRVTCADAAENGQLSAALAEVASSVTEKQAEKLAALCDVKGLKKVLSDGELMRTAECFIKCSLNISAAARELYMHRNTMMYRLDKIKRTTGLDIRVFDEAVAFKILCCVYSRSRGN